MNRTELEALLKKLQSELASGQPVDDELRASLRKLDEDIVQVLGAGGVPLDLSGRQAFDHGQRRVFRDRVGLVTVHRQVVDRAHGQGQRGGVGAAGSVGHRVGRHRD